MRAVFAGALALALSACVLQPQGTTTTAVLNSGDAATSLAVGERLEMSVRTYPAPPDLGQDPSVLMTIRHPDGRTMAFEEANHAPTHIMAQAPGGPLAQVMGLFGEERPTLFTARADESSGQPFVCGPDGPVAIGYYEAPDGSVQVVGLKQQFAFETRPDGVQESVPYSPDQVCARLRFTKG